MSAAKVSALEIPSRKSISLDSENPENKKNNCLHNWYLEIMHDENPENRKSAGQRVNRQEWKPGWFCHLHKPDNGMQNGEKKPGPGNQKKSHWGIQHAVTKGGWDQAASDLSVYSWQVILAGHDGALTPASGSARNPRKLPKAETRRQISIQIDSI